MGREGDRAGKDVDGFPRSPRAWATYPDALGAHDHRTCICAVPVLLDDRWNAAWDGSRHPVRREPRAGQFSHPYRHAPATEAVGDPGDGGGNELCVLVGVAADLVLAAVDLAAQRGALQQDVFQPEAEAMTPLGVRRLGQL